MASQVTYENLFSESRNNVVALITSSNVSDPSIVAPQVRKWIYSRDPDVKSIGFTGYPYIIVHPAEVDFDPDKKSLDLKSNVVFWQQIDSIWYLHSS